jgi:bacterioferritin-associated ferredoxin
MSKKFSHKISLRGREEMQLNLELSESGRIENFQLQGIGGTEFLACLKQWRALLRGDLKSIKTPTGTSTAELMIKELILRARGEWEFPFAELELCHCRAVPVAVVDAAILMGSHTPQAVSRETSASTACGTCRPDVEAILKYRLG